MCIHSRDPGLYNLRGGSSESFGSGSQNHVLGTILVVDTTSAPCVPLNSWPPLGCTRVMFREEPRFSCFLPSQQCNAVHKKRNVKIWIQTVRSPLIIPQEKREHRLERHMYGGSKSCLRITSYSASLMMIC